MKMNNFFTRFFFVVLIGLTLISSPSTPPLKAQGLVDEPNQWQRRTQDLINGVDDPILRNRIITQTYRDLYVSDPETFLWPLMATYASARVGEGMEQAKAWSGIQVPLLDKLLPFAMSPQPGALPPPPGAEFVAEEGVQILQGYTQGTAQQIYNLLAEGNKAVYEDIAWQFMAYQEGGITEILKFKDQLHPLVVEAWLTIDQGKETGNWNLILEGNGKLLQYEQQAVLQPKVYDDNKTIWGVASQSLLRPITGIDQSPIPGDKSRLPQGNIADLDTRLDWVLNDMFDAFTTFISGGPESVSQELNSFMADFTADDHPRPLFFPSGGGGGGAALSSPILTGENSTSSDLGGVDFSSLELNYFSEASVGESTALGYAFQANPAGVAHTPITAEQAAQLASDAFFVWLTLPPDTFWVNLNPNEPDRVIDSELGQTDPGRIMLEADFQMKKTVASLMHPDSDLGQAFWDQLYGYIEAQQLSSLCFSFRQWIVPGEVTVRATADSIYIVEASLDVKLESEYLEVKGASPADSSACDDNPALQGYAEALFRSMILPELIRQVNTAPEYEDLRRIFHARIIAEWYKTQHLASGQAVFSDLINQGSAAGWYAATPWDPQALFDRYVQSITEGEFYLTRQTQSREGDYLVTHTRTYFYGGVDFGQMPMTSIDDTELLALRPAVEQQIFEALLTPAGYQNETEAWLGGLYLVGLPKAAPAATPSPTATPLPPTPSATPASRATPTVVAQAVLSSPPSSEEEPLPRPTTPEAAPQPMPAVVQAFIFPQWGHIAGGLVLGTVSLIVAVGIVAHRRKSKRAKVERDEGDDDWEDWLK